MTAVPSRGRAVVHDEHGGWSLQELEAPSLDAGEVLLRTRVSGLCGTDLYKLSTGRVAAGAVLGHEIVGEVVDSRSPEVEVGQRVVAPHHLECGRCDACLRGATTQCDTFRETLLRPGGFAELIAVSARAVGRSARLVPDDLSDEKAVFLEPAACVLRGIERAGSRDDSSVAILGAGSMGLLHLLVLRAVHPDLEVEMVEPDPARRRLAQQMAVPVHEHAAQLERTPEIVFDTVGGAGPLADALEQVQRGCRVVLFAHALDGSSPVDLNRLFQREISLVPSYSGASSEQERIWSLLLSGELDPSPLVTHRLPIEDFSEGCRLATERRALKVLFTFR